MCSPRAQSGTASSTSSDSEGDDGRAKDDDDWEKVAGADCEERDDHRRNRADAVKDSVSIGGPFASGEQDRANSERKTDQEHVAPRVEEPSRRTYAGHCGSGNQEWNLSRRECEGTQKD